MKSAWSGFLVAFSLYSAVPVPQVQWKRRTMRWALSFLPLVGVLIGAAEWLWYLFCAHYNAATLFYAAGAAILPLILSGGIHLDGLCDTCDALCSYGAREKRLAILKDPHVGAFGPMWLAAFLLAEAACFAQIYETSQFLPHACAGFAIARTLGGCKVILSPCAKDSGLAHLFAENSDKRAVAATLMAEFALLVTVAGLLVFDLPRGGWVTGLMALMLLLWYGLHERLTRRAFGGVTGDLAGFCISVSELIVLACAALGGLI